MAIAGANIERARIVYSIFLLLFSAVVVIRVLSFPLLLSNSFNTPTASELTNRNSEEGEVRVHSRRLEQIPDDSGELPSTTTMELVSFFFWYVVCGSTDAPVKAY